MTLKCPHCNGLLVLQAAVTGSAKQVDPTTRSLVERVEQWLDTPVTVASLLLDAGFDGDLTRYEPLDRRVLRTAFRAKDCLEALGIKATPQWLAYYMGQIPGWTPGTELKRYWGIQGRWYVRTGYEWTPGFVDSDEILI